MNREILFRGKLLNGGKWSYGNLVVKLSGVSIITPDDTPLGKYGQVDQITVGQYTGLTDKNGRKIFEGDIIRSEKMINEESYAIVRHGAFIPKFFYNCVKEAKDISLSSKIIGFYCENPKTKEQFCLTDYTPNVCEIVGNIHDNPELMGGETNDR